MFLQPNLPELQNTDVDPLAPQRVIFELHSAERAFEALQQLARGKSKTDHASTIERDQEGKMRRAEIPWLKRGFIRTEGKRLTCEVNSVKRARKIRVLIESALGEQARYRATEIQSVEQLFVPIPVLIKPGLRVVVLSWEAQVVGKCRRHSIRYGHGRDLAVMHLLRIP